MLTAHCGLMGAGPDAWRAAQSTTCKYNLGNEKLNLGFSSSFFFYFSSFFFSFCSSLEEEECSGKKISLGSKGIAKINKHGMSVLRLNFVW